MVVGHRCDEGLGGNRLVGQVAEVAQGHPEEGGVDGAGSQLEPALLVVLRRQGELDLWILSSESVDDGCGKSPVCPICVCKTEPTFLALTGLAYNRDGVVRMLENATG